MVDGGAAPGSEPTLRSIFSAPALSAARVADPICRFRLLAAQLVTGRGAPAADCLLEGRTGRCSPSAGTAHGQSTSCHAKLAWRNGDFCPPQGPSGPAESAGAPTRGHTLHDA